MNTENKLGVQAILDSRQKIQFVKIQKIFPSYASSNEEKIPKNLVVRVNASEVSYLFKDTIVEGISNYKMYYNKEISVEPGSYMLIITSDNYPAAWSMMSVPGKPDISEGYESTKLTFMIGATISAKGFYYNFYVDYRSIKDADTMFNRIEVPIRVDTNEKNEIFAQYPTSLIPVTDIGGMEKIFLSIGSLIYIRNLIKTKENTSDVFIYKGMLYITSLDWNLTDYLKTVKGYDDPYSVRLDRPDFTNIVNGYGVFGSIHLDSIWFYIPSKVNTED
jgi:hypothetical protein